MPIFRSDPELMFAYDLCRKLGGMTAKEMMARMSYVEFQHWKARAAIKFQEWEANDKPELVEVW